jgi:hypothetical protein
MLAFVLRFDPGDRRWPRIVRLLGEYPPACAAMT